MTYAAREVPGGDLKAVLFLCSSGAVARGDIRVPLLRCVDRLDQPLSADDVHHTSQTVGEHVRSEPFFSPLAPLSRVRYDCDG